MKMNWMVAGAVMGFVGVALGAFGAHGLDGRVGEEAMDWWHTGVFYHLVHAPVLLLLGLLAVHGKGVASAGWAFLLGIAIFSGTLYAMALGAPRWLGAVTPIGGLLLLGGWALLARSGRRSPLVVLLLLASVLSACRRSPGEAVTPPGANLEDPTMEKIEKTDAEWRALLTDEQYRITRQGGTERAFTGEYTDTTTAGFYKCVCCGLPLFRSDAKFHSGCGWPSFFQPLEGFHITELRDTSHGMVRTEVRCKRCDAHLGHVFEDGPAPTGLRYCINSAAIELVPDE